jgi:hypothetical protein
MGGRLQLLDISGGFALRCGEGHGLAIACAGAVGVVSLVGVVGLSRLVGLGLVAWGLRCFGIGGLGRRFGAWACRGLRLRLGHGIGMHSRRGRFACIHVRMVGLGRRLLGLWW